MPQYTVVGTFFCIKDMINHKFRIYHNFTYTFTQKYQDDWPLFLNSNKNFALWSLLVITVNYL